MLYTITNPLHINEKLSKLTCRYIWENSKVTVGSFMIKAIKNKLRVITEWLRDHTHIQLILFIVGPYMNVR